mmetsp:Transcript_73023/g.148249  ORF Transcript_73023/g.148249 Transcript_73023/m.148249 type:complete len:329 (+) Transcript_73023:138-1124(+)|eukprot:CAMPEP_0201200406 /NCGR_PEP_ID=MMETSP0851-20130426/160942_1 /ASSEMBLY_ACC=CAM_ASM_000631 /TAXON_ID=183588 /ORGANISM="Pseudo-nitzschia fraudulenta, Strain WWA7" /LENGTH=328 /DNA_ID=CAMNT_0047487985 /DNA_START=41 /DNA_END=1027 /DNA_ORIENTATION=+
MVDDSEKSYSSHGDYDAAIVAIAIGDDDEMDTEDDDNGYDTILAGINEAINVADDGIDIDHEETWLRQCTGDLPNEIESRPTNFSRLPPEIQMKLVLDLRDREKATLLENLRECTKVVERLKEELYESEDKRMELEYELDTENEEIEGMKREFDEMKEAHKCRIDDILRITREMSVQRERLSRIIEQQQRQSSIVSSNSTTVMPTSENSESYSDHVTVARNQQGGAIALSGNQTQTENPSSRIEVEFERKLRTNPKYREEFERFKEFQLYYHAVTMNHPEQTVHNGSSSEGTGKALNTGFSSSEEYRKMVEFQLGYERILSSAKKESR